VSDSAAARHDGHEAARETHNLAPRAHTAKHAGSMAGLCDTITYDNNRHNRQQQQQY